MDKVRKILIMKEEPKDPPIVLHIMDYDRNNGGYAPLFITLVVKNPLLHNFMLDSRASHNLMPKVIMEKLGLEIIRPYHDLYSFLFQKG